MLSPDDRKTKRRVPPEKRRRTETSCDHCKAKKLKCRRRSSAESCLTCSAGGRSCITTIPRKQRSYSRKTYSSVLDAAVAGPDSFQSNFQSSSLQLRPSFLLSSVSPSRGSPFLPAPVGIARSPPTSSACHPALLPTPAVERLFDDDYGLPRYVGPTGSYTFMVKLREIMATKCAPKTAGLRYAQTMGQSIRLYDTAGGQTTADLPPKEAADAMVELFFSQVHRDFPIFHRAPFMAMYEDMWSSSLGPNTEPAWLMALGMVFVLGLDAASSSSSGENALPMLTLVQQRAIKDRYLATAKDLLPEVLSGCTLGHVQAIMLYCRQLYISGNRNASWSLAGAAVRIAVAIGLHRNGANARCHLLERELRKRVWWTLYAFERMECSSLGRTSAIDDNDCNVGFPVEGLLDMGDIIPLGHVTAQSQLLRLLGSVCKQQYQLASLDSSSPTNDNIAGALLQKLDAWHRNLPAHLRLDTDGVPSGPASHVRAITLLHIQYYYTITLLCRPFLVIKATTKSHHVDADQDRDRDRTASAIVAERARQCMDSAKMSIQLLQRLFLCGLFNATTWWDVFFLKSSSMMLALGAIVHDDAAADFDPRHEALSSLKICLSILAHCGKFSPTMKNFATMATDLGRAVILTEATEVTDATEASPDEVGSTCETSGGNPTQTTTVADPDPPSTHSATSTSATASTTTSSVYNPGYSSTATATTTGDGDGDGGLRVGDIALTPFFFDTYNLQGAQNTHSAARTDASFLDAFPDQWILTPEDWNVMGISRHLNFGDT